jgi:hypothetical protein
MSEQTPEPPGEPPLRASDADREQTVALLRDSAADGRLTLGELTERIEHAYGARTLGELEPLTVDLAPSRTGVGGVNVPAAARRSKPRTWFVAVMGGSSRGGRWRVGRRVNAVAVMGGVSIDLRNAELDEPEVVVTAVTVMGGIDICVPEGVEVEIEGFVLMGGKDMRIRGVPRPGAPLVRVRAWGLMGGVDVHTPKQSGDDAS